MAGTNTAPQSSLQALQALGLYNGIGDIYVAKMTTEDTETTAPVYDTPILAAEAVNIGLTPQLANASQPASNRMIRKMSLVKGMQISAEYPRIIAAVRRYILGRAVDANGGEIVSDSVAPNMAFGFKETRDDGTVHMRWIYKTVFREGNVQAKTSEEGTVAYRIPTLDGDAVALTYVYTDSAGAKHHFVQYEADTSDANCKWTETSFFAAVVGPWSDPIT